MSDLPDPIPAATLILMRPGASGSPELLLMERSAGMAFAAGALVFPGGRIDPGDVALAGKLGAAMEDAAARIAAIRETIEETGIAVGITPEPDVDLIARMRSALEQEADFGALLESSGLSLDLGALTPYARWCPNFRETRRFDTMFFVAEASGDEHADSAAEGEAVRTLWMTAAQTLAEADSGQAHIIFPTRRNLERLALSGSIEEARADAESHPVRKVVPWIEEREGDKWLCIPEDAGYPVTAERLETARRG